MPTLSAVGAVSPAFDTTKRQLLAPFRFGHWARLAVVSLLTGEFAGSGGWSGGTNFTLPGGGGTGPGRGMAWVTPPRLHEVLKFLPWILGGIAALIGLGLVLIFVSSVYRFILFDAVISNRCELRAGWRRWQRQGGSYFLWQIGFELSMMAGVALLVSVPLVVAWRAGIFRRPDEHVALLVLGGIGLFVLVLALILAGVIASLFAKDFVVPFMALENVGVLEGWRRVLPMLAVEKGAFGGYVLMKIVLAVGSAIFFGIVNVFLILGLLIPLGAAGFLIYLLAQHAGLAWDVYTISGAVALGAGAIA